MSEFRNDSKTLPASSNILQIFPCQNLTELKKAAQNLPQNARIKRATVGYTQKRTC
jgi:hypothetical protein